MSKIGRLASIHIYPVKGMRACDLDLALVEPRGLRGDRRFVVVDAEGVFLSQRGNPELATIIASFDANTLELSDGLDNSAIFEYLCSDRRMIRIWNDDVDACDMGDEAADWLSARLDSPVRLAWMDDLAIRPVSVQFGALTDEVSFADGFPLLVTNTASLDDLNRRMEVPIPMNRFRPNVVIDGLPAWAEDEWTLLRVGACTFRVVKPCARCLVTTTDQATGERMGQEPLRTLATFREINGKAMFGQNLIPNELGSIRVDDVVEVLA